MLRYFFSHWGAFHPPRMKKAKPNAIFMHCLPVGRGEEVTDEVIDGDQSVVWRQALNRVHAQKAIIKWCIS